MKYKYLMVCLFMLLFLSACMQNNAEKLDTETNQPPSEQTVIKPEKESIYTYNELGEMIAYALNKPLEEISTTDLLAIEKLIIIGKTAWINEDISFYTYPVTNGIEWSEGDVYYSENRNLVDIHDISKMHNLEVLIFSNCGIQDISPVQSL